MFTNKEIQALSVEKQAKLEKLIQVKGDEYGVYPLSAEQERMWFLYKVNEDSPFYSGMDSIEFTGEVSVDAITYAIKRLIEKHSVLRTVFITLNGTTYQVVNDKFDVPIEQVDLTSMKEEEKKEAFSELVKKETNTVFRLSEEIPIKVIVVKWNEERTTMLYKLHHICYDGWSVGIFLREFLQMYKEYMEGNQTDEVEKEYQYTDYERWQREQKVNHVFDKEIEYWKETLGESKQKIYLNYEKESSKQNSMSNGAVLIEVLPSYISKKIQDIANKFRTSVFAVTMSAFYLVLSKNANQTNINIGTTVANRQKQEFENIFGYFANTVVINADLDYEMTFFDLLHRVSDRIINAMANQDVPFDMVVNKLNIERTADLSPLFQIMYSFRNNTMVNGDISSVWHLPNVDAQFKLLESDFVGYVQYKIMFTVTHLDENMEFCLAYDKYLYEEEYMKLFMSEFIAVLSQLDVENDIKLKDIQLQNIESNTNLNKKFRVLDENGKQAVIGQIGNVEYKSEDDGQWIGTKDKGFEDYNAELHIVHKDESIFDIDGKQYTREELLNGIALKQVHITMHKEDETSVLMIYYVASKEIDSNEFLNAIPSELKNKVKILTWKLSYFPNNRFGYIDSEKLDQDIYQGLYRINILKEKVEKTDGVSNVAMIMGSSFDGKIDEVDLFYVFGQQLPKTLQEELNKENINVYQVDDIPVNEEGTVDREKLRQIAESKKSKEELTNTEKEVKAIWETILEKENISIYSKFFEAGGTSIKSLQVVAAMMEKFNVKLEVVDLFKYTNIKAFAKYIDSLTNQGTTEEENDDMVGLTF